LLVASPQTAMLGQLLLREGSLLEHPEKVAACILVQVLGQQVATQL